MEAKWIEHNAKKILVLDFRGESDDRQKIDLLKQGMEMEKAVSWEFNSLVNLEGTFTTKEFMDEVKKTMKEAGHGKSKKTALLGIKGVKNILLQGYIYFTGDKTIKTFENEKDAIDWLTAD